MTIDAILAQYGPRRTRAARYIRRSDIFFGIEAQRDSQSRVMLGGLRGKLLIGALRIIAQPAHAPRGLGPRAPQVDPRLIELQRTDSQLHAQLAGRRADIERRVPKTVLGKNLG